MNILILNIITFILILFCVYNLVRASRKLRQTRELLRKIEEEVS